MSTFAVTPANLVALEKELSNVAALLYAGYSQQVETLGPGLETATQALSDFLGDWQQALGLFEDNLTDVYKKVGAAASYYQEVDTSEANQYKNFNP